MREFAVILGLICLGLAMMTAADVDSNARFDRLMYAFGLYTLLYGIGLGAAILVTMALEGWWFV